MALVTWEPRFRLGPEHAIRAFVEGFAHLAGDAFAAALERFRTGMALNRENPAMNDDIGKVVAAIEALRVDGGPVAVATGAAADGAHVLLSAYRQQGSVH